MLSRANPASHRSSAALSGASRGLRNQSDIFAIFRIVPAEGVRLREKACVASGSFQA